MVNWSCSLPVIHQEPFHLLRFCAYVLTAPPDSEQFLSVKWANEKHTSDQVVIGEGLGHLVFQSIAQK